MAFGESNLENHASTDVTVEGASSRGRWSRSDAASFISYISSMLLHTKYVEPRLNGSMAEAGLGNFFLNPLGPAPRGNQVSPGTLS